MGLFDNIGQTPDGHMSFVQEAQAFARLDLNRIFVEATKAAIDIVGNAIKFFTDVFGHKDCSDQDAVLYERLRDQIPGMIIVLVKVGLEDSTMLQGYKDNPLNADYGGRPHGSFPCNQGIGPARSLFTTLFGVRIFNSNYLDALEQGADAYYRLDNGDLTKDIPREAVTRAVMLKQTFFPNSTYNRKLWDMNIFQQFPLVKPIPDPNTVGRLFTGSTFGVQVLNGLVQGSPVPNIPALVTTPGVVPIYTTTPPVPVQQPNASGAGTNGPLDSLISFVKTNPMKAIALAGAVALAVNELEHD